MGIQYQKEMERITEGLRESGRIPSLLLHSCCAPCSSYCLTCLTAHFHITVFYYNPNITDPEEYRKRVGEQKRLIAELPAVHPIRFLEGAYEPSRFFEAARGLEQTPEGGERCLRCYRLRLFETARIAAEEGFEWFTTTLTISPLKNAEALNGIGQEAGCQYGVPFLPSDFKKKDGYRRSVELSREYGLYRQNYCGCIFSRNAAQAREAARTSRPSDSGFPG